MTDDEALDAALDAAVRALAEYGYDDVSRSAMLAALDAYHRASVEDGPSTADGKVSE